MRFAMSERSNINQGVQAANAAVQATSDIHKTYRKYSPDYAGLLEQAAKNKSAEKQGAMKVAETTGIAGIKAASNVATASIGSASQVSRAVASANASKSIAKTRANANVATGMMNRASRGISNMRARAERSKARKQALIASLQPRSGPDWGSMLQAPGKGGGFKAPGAPQLKDVGGGSGTPKRTDLSGLADGITSLGGGSRKAGKVGAVAGINHKALDIIGKYESDSMGGYEAYNLGGSDGGHTAHGSGNSAKDNRFGKPLTQMSIGELKQLQSSGKLHAAGRYQFIGNSLPEAAQFAGLQDSDVFSKGNQDRMVHAFGKKYGSSRWVGLDHASGEELKTVKDFFSGDFPAQQTLASSQGVGDPSATSTTNIVSMGQHLQGQGFTVKEHPQFGGVGKHSPNSHHYAGHAIDITDWRDDNHGGVHWKERTKQMGEKLRQAFPNAEIFHPGYDPVGGHDTHIHFALPGGTANLSAEQKQMLGIS